MKSAAFGFLSAVLGTDGAQALARAAGKQPGLEPILVPRAALAWVKARNNYQSHIPGVEGTTLRLRKTEAGFTGVVTIGGGSYTFEDQSPEHVAAALAVAVDVDFQDRGLRSPELQRLGKSIDALVQTQDATAVLSKAILDPGHGYKFSAVHHDMGDETLTHIKVHDAQGQEVGGTVLGHGPSSQGLYPYDLDVHPAHRRKGLATAMYNHAQQLLGKPVVPSRTQTGDAQAFWASRTTKAEIKDTESELANAAYRHRRSKEVMVAGDRHDRQHPSIKNVPDSVLHEDWEPGYVDRQGVFLTMAEAARLKGRPEDVHSLEDVRALEKTDLPGTTAKPQKPLGPVEAEKPQKQTQNMSAKPKLPKPGVLKVEKSEIGRTCTMCGGTQFRDLDFRGCLCHRDLKKHVKVSVYGETLFLEFGRGADPDAVRGLREVFNG